MSSHSKGTVKLFVSCGLCLGLHAFARHIGLKGTLEHIEVGARIQVSKSDTKSRLQHELNGYCSRNSVSLAEADAKFRANFALNVKNLSSRGPQLCNYGNQLERAISIFMVHRPALDKSASSISSTRQRLLK